MFHTEYVKNGIVYRSHPNFQSDGAWYDWAMVKFADENEAVDDELATPISNYPSDMFPSKIIAFVTHHPSNGDPEELNAIVHSCEYNDHEWDSVITEN